MGIRSYARLTCDRCGATRDVEGSFSTAASLRLDDKLAPWASVGERVLCPECARGYEVMRARHSVEEEDYVTGATKNHDPR